MSEVDAARATFDRAVAFLKSGDVQTAEKISRAALTDYPGEMNFLALLGAALVRQGRAGEGEPYLRQAVEANPDYAKGHEQYAEALLALDRPEEAVEALRRALELNPAFDGAHLKLGRTLLCLGREEEAKKAYEDFIRQSPHRQRLAEAAEFHRNGELREAEAVYRQILRDDPGNVSAMRLLALVAMKLEQYRDAAVLLKQVVKLAPDFQSARLDLGHAQTELHEFDDAIRTMQQAVRLDPLNYAPRVGLATALARSTRAEEAVECYRQAIELNPEVATTWLGLGNVSRTLGRYDEAVAAYRKGIELRPGFAELYWSLSNLKTFHFDPAEVEAMRAEVEKPDIGDAAIVHLSFALGKAAEDEGDYAQAFGWYERGNHLRRKQESYDPVQTEVIGERIRAMFSRDFIARHSGGGYRDARPIFIVGLPRSGSTLLEQILASHPSVEATHELPEGGRLIKFIDRQRSGRELYPEACAAFPAEAFFELGKRYDVETRRYRSGCRHFIDKMPNNFANLGLLALCLPEARFINARRHPMDTCLSCYKQLFARGQSFTYDLEELVDYYLEYQRMMDHWHDVLPGRILDMQYENVVADLENQVAQLLDHCGLPWDDACLDFHNTKRAIRTASSEQVRRPIYTDAVGYWERFGNALNPLREMLGPVLPDGGRRTVPPAPRRSNGDDPKNKPEKLMGEGLKAG